MVQGNDSIIFPKIAICKSFKVYFNLKMYTKFYLTNLKGDVKTRELEQSHLYTLQCILTFNLYNERIYAFLWFWIFTIVISFTLVDLISWLSRVMFGSIYRYNFVKKRLKVFVHEKNDRLIRKFANKYLGPDIIFLLRLLEYNASATLVYDLINQMWDQFKNEMKK